MTKLQFIFLLIAVFTGSIIGGGAVQSFNPQTARADNNRTITCNKLVIKSDKGKGEMNLGFSEDGNSPFVWLKNHEGYVSIMTADIFRLHSPNAEIMSLYMASGLSMIDNHTSRFYYGLDEKKAFIMGIQDKNKELLWYAPNSAAIN